MVSSPSTPNQLRIFPLCASLVALLRETGMPHAEYNHVECLIGVSATFCHQVLTSLFHAHYEILCRRE